MKRTGKKIGWLNILRLRELVPYKLVRRVSEEKIGGDSTQDDEVKKAQYDYVPKDSYVYGPADTFLLVPKNRYRLVLLPGQKISGDAGVGWLTEDNSPQGYDRLWGDPDAVERFREEADGVREKLTVEIADHIIERIRGESHILDVGCGVGDLLTEIRKRRANIALAGCDFSPCGIEKARCRLPEGDFTQQVIEKDLPYENDRFDAVLCTDTLEHLEYPANIVNEMVRICRPGGFVVIVVPDGDVDQFFGHLWFWNENRLREFLSPWNGIVQRLPKTREFLAVIDIPEVKKR